jgi:internalin A
MDENEYELQETEAGTDLIIKGGWNQAAATVLEGHADGLVLNYAKGFNEHGLRFLESWPITRLTILDRSIQDLSPIYRMSATLRELSIQTSPDAILDLKQLPDLTRVSASWGQVRDTINTLARLTHLFLLNFNSPDLTVFQSNKALENIQMKDRPKIGSLKGFNELPMLVDLGIFLAPKLKDLNELKSGNDKLHTLQA